MKKMALGAILMAFAGGALAQGAVGGTTNVVAGGASVGGGAAVGGAAVITTNAALITAGVITAGGIAAGSKTETATTHQ